MTHTPSPHLWILDGYGFVYRAFHALPPLKRKDGVPVGAVYGFTTMLLKLLEEEQPSHIVVVFDEGGKNHRHALYPAYKAHRPPAPEDLLPQFPLVRDVTQALQLPSIESAGAEADDIIATLVATYRDQLPITILSSDKDLMQLVGGQVDMLDPVKLKRFGVAAVEERFGVSPPQVLEVLALMGDSADNIPGVPGIGPKTATELIQRFGSLEGLYAGLDQLPAGKRRENLTLHREDAFLSRELATLKADVPLTSSLPDWVAKPLDHDDLRLFLQKMEFHSLLRKFEQQWQHSAPTPMVTETWEVASIKDLPKLEQWCERALDASEWVLIPEYQHDQLHTLQCYVPSLPLLNITLGGMASEPVQTSLFDITPVSQPFQLSDVLPILAPLLHARSLLKIVHNAKRLLRHMYDAKSVLIQPLTDVMLMAYLLASQQRFELFADVAEHCLLDSTLPIYEQYLQAAHALKRALMQEQLLTLYEQIERPLIPVLAAMEWRGIAVDRAYLQGLSHDFQQQIDQLAEEIYQQTGTVFNIASSKQLGTLLVEKMGLPLYKKTSKSKAIDTSAEVLEELAAQGHTIASLLLQWRGLSKLQSTYTEALLQQIHPKTGRIHTTFAMTATNTGRLSSQNPNLQNIPIRSEEGQKIRRAFIAQPGYQLIMADYSQIELRVLAHMADIHALQDAFQQGKDIHSLTASQMFSVPLAEVDSAMRRKAKAINFGIIYGMSAFGLANRLGILRQEAASIIERYFRTYPGIEHYMSEQKRLALEQGYVRTLFGRICPLPHIKSSNMGLRSNAERAAINAPIQGTAADIMKKAMLQVATLLHGHDAQMLLQIHDELVIEVKTDQAETVSALVKQAMEQTVSFKVPLVVDVCIGQHLGEKL